MLGAGSSGAMQLRGRISVVPGGQASPAWMGVPRPPPRPRPVGCWAWAALPRQSPTVKAARTNTLRMEAPEREYDETPQFREGRVRLPGLPSFREGDGACAYVSVSRKSTA